jgi:hypothetical protein
MAAAPAPVLHPDGIEEHAANVDAIYYTDENGDPLPPMTVEEYQTLEEAGEAFICHDATWPRVCLLQDIAPEMVSVLEERYAAAQV